MPVVFSPKILPFHIKKVPVRAAKIPAINNFLLIVIFCIFFRNTTVHIKKTVAKPNKIPNIKNFIVIVFLLTNYLDPYFILPKNGLQGDPVIFYNLLMALVENA